MRRKGQEATNVLREENLDWDVDQLVGVQMFVTWLSNSEGWRLERHHAVFAASDVGCFVLCRLVVVRAV